MEGIIKLIPLWRILELDTWGSFNNNNIALTHGTYTFNIQEVRAKIAQWSDNDLFLHAEQIFRYSQIVNRLGNTK